MNKKNSNITSIFAVFLFIISSISSTTSHAFSFISSNGCEWGFLTPPRVVLHTADIPAGITKNNMIGMMEDIHAHFNSLSDVNMYIGEITTSPTRLTHQSWKYDFETGKPPTIHVGFDNGDGNARGSVRTLPGCLQAEAHITIDKVKFLTGEPQDYLKKYYWEAKTTTDPLTGDDVQFLRKAYAHELLHVFGLDHSFSTNSVMNYKESASWFNRDAGGKFRFMPDDVAGLRSRYPTNEQAKIDIAVSNIYFDENDFIYDSNDTLAQAGILIPVIAKGKKLCKPSKGDEWSDPWLSGNLVIGQDSRPSCGYPTIHPEPGDSVYDVCPGDWIKTRIALSNYSSRGLAVKMQLWFSAGDDLNSIDDQLDRRVDIKAPGFRTINISNESSILVSEEYKVPEDARYNQRYQLITRAVVSSDLSGSSINRKQDWIPMMGTGITIKSLKECGGDLRDLVDVL